MLSDKEKELVASENAKKRNDDLIKHLTEKVYVEIISTMIGKLLTLLLITSI